MKGGGLPAGTGTVRKAEATMKVVCEKEKLNHLVQTALRAVSSRVTMPILSGLLLRADGRQVTACGTDLEVSIRVCIDAEVKQGGSAVVSAKMLGDIVKSLPPGRVEIESEDRFLTLRSESGVYRIRGMMPEDFPAIPDWQGESTIECDASLFVKAVQQTSRASSSDEKRPILTGTLVERNLEDGMLRMVTTDSYRLSWKDVEIRGSLGKWEDCVVPTSALVEVARIASGAGSGVEMKIQDNQVMFRIDDMVVRSRLIEGQFPSYRQLVPQGDRNVIEVQREPLSAVIRRALVFGNNIRLEISENKLQLSTETREVGESSEEIPVDFAGEAMEVGFNGTFLLDGITAAGGDKLTIRMDSSKKPALIKSDEDAGFTYVLMPVRIKQDEE